jgi:mRNA-degrading endonuclease RelE of RelBE toxin-antitoxin system
MEGGRKMKIAISPNAEKSILKLTEREQPDIKVAVTKLENLGSCEELINRSVRIPDENNEIYKIRLDSRVRMIFKVVEVKEQKYVFVLSFYKYGGD